MDITLLSRFVASTAADTGSTYTLRGERIAPTDLGDEHGMLPLIVAAMHSINRKIYGGASLLTVLAPADPNKNLLGMQVTKLPSAPEGALLLLANHAVRHYLNQPPMAPMALPTFVDEPPAKICELEPHLLALGLQAPMPSRSQPSAADELSL